MTDAVINPLAIVAGPPLFATPRNMYIRATGTTIGVEFDTDQAIQLSLVWQRTDPGADPGQAPLGGTVTDAAAATHHLLVTPASLAPGQAVLLTVQLASTDSTGLTFRPIVTQQKTIGARAAGRQAFGYNLSVPVRFHAFGGTPPAPAGGTGGQGGGTGNWNQYTWAQYNPKGTTYPTP